MSDVKINKFEVNGKEVLFDESKLTKLETEVIYDVTANNNGATFASLSALLSDENLSILIPSTVRCGGMSIRFVQSSDNKYVQYRLIADSWSIDTDDWSFCGDDVIVENPEYINVKTDSEGRILWAIKTDGSIYWGAGVPQQAIDYVAGKIAELSLDEDIVAFLDGIQTGDKTLQELLNEKEDSVEGKSLIDSDYAEGVSHIENPEYVAAWIDKNNKVIFGFKVDGKTFVGDAEFLDDITANSTTINDINSILSNTIDYTNIDWNAVKSIMAVENPEYIDVETDANNKVLGGRKTDGTKVENVGLETPNAKIEEVEISGGTATLESASVESLETDSLNLTEQGMTEFQQALINSGFNTKNVMDWSEEEFVQIPLPRGLARVNIICDALPTSKDTKYKATIEFWDMGGNYFKKPIKKFTCQGNSSMNYGIKNFAFDVDDDSEWKFGHWVPQDSFHLKAFYIDVFVGLGNIQYNYIEDLYRKLGCRPSRKAFDDSEITIRDSIGNLKQDFGTGSMCHPEGFPFELYVNGEYYALYAFNLKKHRDNYLMKKDDYTSIMIDGWTNDPSDVNKDFWKGENYIPWTGGDRNLELKNPKPLICMDGTEYDDDSPKELIDTTSEYWDATNEDMANTLITKNIIITMSNNWKHTQDLVDEADAIEDAEQKAAKLAEAKTFLATFYDIDAAIFHYIFGQIVGNSEGMYGSNTQWMIYNGQWMAPTLYDLDCGFGRHGYGVAAIGIGTIYGSIAPYTILGRLYADEIKDFYVNGRKKGVIDIDYFMSFFEDYIEKVGYSAYKRNIDKREELHFDIPSYRSNNLNSENWVKIENSEASTMYNEQTSYSINDKCLYGDNPRYAFKCISPCTGIPPFTKYENRPYDWGFYDSPKRIRKWLDARFVYLDNYFKYNN